jgi:hypothetical protein
VKNFQKIFLIVVFLSANNSFGRALDLLTDAKPVPFFLNGTLNPSFLSLNGAEISNTSEHVLGLELNGKSVEIRDVSGLAVISEETNSSVLKLAWILTGGSRIPIKELNYPALNALKLSRKDLSFQMNEFASSFRLDDLDVQMSEGKGDLEIEDTESWLSRPHIITLTGKAGSNRIYHLDSSTAGHDYFPESIVSFHNTRPLYAGSGSEFNFTYIEKFKKHLLGGLSLGYAQGYPWYPHDEKSIFHTYTLYLKPLYEPFTHDASVFSFKRITLGLSLALRYLKVSNGPGETALTAPQFSGIATPTSQFDFIPGFVFRFEPIIWHNFGLTFELDFFDLASREQLPDSKTRPHLELTYHW